jgi:hypothetical protein
MVPGRPGRGPAARLMRRDPRSASPPGGHGPRGRHDGRSADTTAIKEDPVRGMCGRSFRPEAVHMYTALPGPKHYRVHSTTGSAQTLRSCPAIGIAPGGYTRSGLMRGPALCRDRPAPAGRTTAPARHLRDWRIRRKRRMISRGSCIQIHAEGDMTRRHLATALPEPGKS